MAHHNSTPTSVLEAPKSTPETIWPVLNRPLRWTDSLGFGPYTSTKERKVRKGRKARFNK